MEGTIKKLTDKNFGFITSEGQDNDIFFHASELAEVDFSELSEGDSVTFEVKETPKGPAATQVKKA
ncbi:MAG TPA: cold shock domain-containing protein [Patescibacteria group bacterium]|nr:cold shock domain-containing protein [Patescibacteria group bacterium]